ncbi:MAG: glutamine amidotransferase [Rikenellaceae bacterium]
MILILKTGSTLANIRATKGDFEDWIKEKMQLNEFEYHVHSVENYKTLPPEQHYSGIIITGSPLMVTDIKLEDNNMCNWLLDKQRSGTPILGICFGHQLLSILNGGSVEYNFSGTKIGSTKTYLTMAGQQDKLLGALPLVFEVYKTHKQSVSTLPESVEILATNNSGIIDAIKFNANTWGVQFHPEFDANITKLYIQEKYNELSAEGLDVQELLKNVVNVDYGDRILKRFKEIVDNANKGL